MITLILNHLTIGKKQFGVIFMFWPSNFTNSTQLEVPMRSLSMFVVRLGNYRSKLWTAPEILRITNRRPLNGTQKGDVYSFAIVMQEIFFRAQPFFCDNLPPRGK